MEPLVGSSMQELLSEKLLEIEEHFDIDVFNYYGPIVDGSEYTVLNIIEQLVKDPLKRDRLLIILTTTGGSAVAVKRYVNIIRKHYIRSKFCYTGLRF